MPSNWGFGNKPSGDPMAILGEDPTHPRGDAEVVQHGTSLELRPRTGSSTRGMAVDIPEKTMQFTGEELSEDEAARRLKNFKKSAEWDPNMPKGEMDAVDDALASHDVHNENDLVNGLLENSPYPEVRYPLSAGTSSH